MRPSPTVLHGLLIAGLAAFAGAGCSSTTASPAPPVVDAGGTPTDVPVATDTGSGADGPAADSGHPAAPSMIYGPCVTDSDCQTGLSCLSAAATGHPGGVCNRDCTADEQCVLQETSSSAVDGFCLDADPTTHRRLCARVCANGIDCERAGYTCLSLNQGQLNQTDVCIGVCSDTNCGAGSTCDHQSGRCVATGAPPVTGQHIGDPCVPTGQPGATAANHCISDHCSPAAVYDSMMRPTYTGFNGGSCYSYCVLPAGFNASTFFDGANLPQGDCPDGSLCFPNGTLTRGDLGVCVHSCMANTDCRAAEGYYCEKSFQVTQTRSVHFPSGICTRINCANPATPCPTGLTCLTTTTASGSSGRCIPPAT